MRIALTTTALAFVAVATSGCRSAQSVSQSQVRQAVVANAQDVITAMHDRYEDKWYRTLRFRQNVIYQPNAAGVTRPTEVMLEHAEIPGSLRIDLGANYTGRGNLYTRDSLYIFSANAPVRRIKNRNPLMILGFDVYRQPTERSLAVLREEGFDMTRFREDTWQGRPVYVVGADAGDLHTKQFWIDKERLVFVRLLNPAGPGGTRTSEVRFDRYVPFGGAWISPYVVFLTDGKEMQREEYFDMEANPKIPAGLFDPDQWNTVRPN